MHAFQAAKRGHKPVQISGHTRLVEVKLYKAGRSLKLSSNDHQLRGYLDALNRTRKKGDAPPTLDIVTLEGVKVSDLKAAADKYKVNIRVFRAYEKYNSETGESRIYLKHDKTYAPGVGVQVGGLRIHARQKEDGVVTATIDVDSDTRPHKWETGSDVKVAKPKK